MLKETLNIETLQKQEEALVETINESTREKIYAENFRRLWGNQPQRVDLEAAIST